ncbi:MAG: hypothetical protein ACXWVD_16835 [Telluria sp.]
MWLAWLLRGYTSAERNTSSQEQYPMKHGFKMTALGAGLALAVLVSAPGPAHAAAGDKPGAACAAAVREYKGAMPNAMLVRGWMPGATSAPNPTPGTFDFVPWHDLNTVANSIGGYCAQKTKMNFAQAVSGLTSALGHKRLQAASAPVKLRSDGASLVRYGRTLSRVALTLMAKGGSF